MTSFNPSHRPLPSPYAESNIDLDSDVFTDSSSPYADATTCLRHPETHIHHCQTLNPYPTRRSLFYRLSHLIPGYSSSPTTCHSYVYKNRHKRLETLHRKLKSRNKLFAKILAGMSVVLVMSLTPLCALYPELAPYFLGQVFMGGSSSKLTDCDNMESFFSEDVYRRCRRSGSPSWWSSGLECGLDVETALCLLSEAKNDMDNRTKTLDDAVSRTNEQLEEIIPTQTISAMYDLRPNIHLSLYYSAESGGKGTTGVANLKWVENRGLASGRRMHTVTEKKNKHIILSFRAGEHPGYYYVYSHVTFNSNKLPHTHPLQSVYICNAEKQACNSNTSSGKLLLRSYDLTSGSASYLSGVFKLGAWDNVYVIADYDLVDNLNPENTYVGAYMI